MTMDGSGVAVGPYTGEVAPAYRAEAVLAQLARLGDLLRSENGTIVSEGRHRHVKVPLVCGGVERPVMVKCFGLQGALKDLLDRRRGSKAQRTWQAASFLHGRGVGTPPPVGYLERWSGARLLESYFLSEYRDGLSSFRDELVRLFRLEPECDRFMALLQGVAESVRVMHDAGLQHNDLGNQNIALRRTGAASWGDVQFLDLNRSRVRPRLSSRQRARDLSRIALPSDFLRVFKEMYDAERSMDPAFQRAERFYRRLYAWHSRTRFLRHPLREARIRRLERDRPTYPKERDLWVWDERSGQAVSVLRPRDRLRHYPPLRHARIAWTAATGCLPVWSDYRRLLARCYAAPVSMGDRVGVALHPTPERLERELALLAGLGRVPVLIRFYHHQSEREWDHLAGVARRLHAAGHKVAAALVQDRRAVTDPGRWRAFAGGVLDALAGATEWVEVGHAINRVKWGVWGFREHRRLLDAVADAVRGRAGVSLMGPAVIDFEYPFLMTALRNLPPGMRFGALSHHLYVDRRGAPENRQGPFCTLEKFALARAIARWSGRCDDRLIVSEVNWPLKGTGVYSPVGSPYESPGERSNDPSVSEDAYADFMIRYLLIALCSGMVERVYWWRLAAHGYGLADDRGPGAWRPRPAYARLKQFLDLLGGATFEVKRPSPAGRHLFGFRRTDGRAVCVAYSAAGPAAIEPPFAVDGVLDGEGRPLAAAGRALALDGRPLYLFHG